jgi:hypothetical protein
MNMKSAGALFAWLLLAGLVMLGAATPGLAQGLPGDGVAPHTSAGKSVTLPVRLVDGHIIMAADLVSREATHSVTLMVDLGAPHRLALHAGLRDALSLADDENSITLVASNGFRAEVPADGGIREYTGAVDLGRMTALHSAALDQRPLAGSVGAGFLKNYHVVLDLAAGTMSLGPPRQAGADIAGGAGGSAIRFQKQDSGKILLPVRYGLPDSKKDETGYMLLSAALFDTYLNSEVAKKAEAPAGNIGSVYLGGSGSDAGFDLSRFVAFRPLHAPIPGVPDAEKWRGQDILLTAGTNLLRNFRVEIDWVNSAVSLTQTRVAAYPQEELAYFEAEAFGNGDSLEAFLGRHPDSRLAEEAATQLVERRIEEKAGDARLIEAARLFRDNASEKMRGAACLALMLRFAESWADRPDLVIAVGELGLDVVRNDADPLTLYRIHDAMGRQRLARGDIKGAWKNFLSAAFGMPKDARVNLNLGRVYEEQGRSRRAYSRYKRAATEVAEMSKQGIDVLSPEDLAELRSAEARLRAEFEQ